MSNHRTAASVFIDGKKLAEVPAFEFDRFRRMEITRDPLRLAIKLDYARRFPEFPFMLTPVARIVRDLNHGITTWTVEERARAMGIIH